MNDWGKPIFRDDGSIEIVDPSRVSFYVVGLFPNGNVHIQSLNPQRIWEPLNTFEVHAMLLYLCLEAIDESDPDMPATLIGVIRVQHEGEELKCYHTYISSDIGHDGDYVPTDDQISVMQGAIIRVMCAGTGFIEERDGAERAIEGAQIMESIFGGE